MQQEDDLRALAKIMDFGRAVSIFIMVIHVYVYCYPSMAAWQLTLDVIDRILLNFDRTTGIFGCILWTKLLAVLLLAISCMGTIGVKGEKITWHRIWAVLTAGAVLFFLNWWLLDLPFPHEAVTSLYVLTLTAGYLCLLMAGLWISRLYRNNLMEDVFNQENESFMQETRLIENEYSVNLPTRFRYAGKDNDGWINVVNPFRATIVLGTPGSGKSYAVVNNYIRQMISKGFSVYIYDYKFDDLSAIAYNTLLHNMDKYKVKPPEGCICIEDNIYEYEGIRFLGLGGSNRYKPGDNQYTQKEMTKRVKKLWWKLKRNKGFDVLVTHSPAKGLHDGEDICHTGFDVFNRLIEQYRPKYFVHGHVHMSYGRQFVRLDKVGETTVINAYEKYIVEI